MQMPSTAEEKESPSSLLPLQMSPMVASPFLGSTNPLPLRGCELEACFGPVQRAKSPLRAREDI